MAEILDRRGLLGGSAALVIGFITSPARAYVNERDPFPELAADGAQWLLVHFGDALRPKVAATRWPLSLALAMAYQETAYTWWHRANRVGKTPEQIMRLLVLDANEPRGRKINGHNTIYPRHAASFLSDPRWTAIAPGLIAASEASRDWRRRKRTGKLLYGYGLFQNDLQNIQDKRFTHFWTDAAPPIKGMDLTGQTGLWADVGVCADVFLSELEDKYAVTKDIWKAAEAYNGTGPSAEIYIANVRNYEAAIRRKGVQ